MNQSSKIYIAGHGGLVGSALVRCLKKQGFENLVFKTHRELDLTRQNDVEIFFQKEKPDYVFLAAAKVGGIHANNTLRAEFIYSNLAVQTNVIHSSYLTGVKKLLFLGSSCIYPRLAPQPLKEEYLLTAPLEPTNEPYAIAKIAGIKMCESYNRQYGTNYISVMPTNLYGPDDNYDLNHSHVLPAMLRKFHEALPNNPVTLWGSGSPRREFLYVDDAASACIHLMQNYQGSEIVNIGAGEDLTIRELAGLIQKSVGHKGPIIWDSSKPDGMPQKLLDISKIKSLGWKPSTSLHEGIRLAYEDFKKNFGKGSVPLP